MLEKLLIEFPTTNVQFNFNNSLSHPYSMWTSTSISSCSLLYLRVICAMSVYLTSARTSVQYLKTTPTNYVFPEEFTITRNVIPRTHCTFCTNPPEQKTSERVNLLRVHSLTFTNQRDFFPWSDATETAKRMPQSRPDGTGRTN